MVTINNYLLRDVRALLGEQLCNGNVTRGEKCSRMKVYSIVNIWNHKCGFVRSEGVSFMMILVVLTCNDIFQP